jgi:signal transduction histidine kinase
MVATTLLAVVVFGVPLAYAVELHRRDDEVDRLQRLASTSTAVVPADGAVDRSLPLPTAPAGVDLALYDASGHRVAGTGPEPADNIAATALRSGSSRTSATHEGLVAVAPVNVGGRSIAVVRAAESEDVTNTSVRTTWAEMGLVALLAAAASVALGVVLARRLVRPLRRLRDDARRLGNGDFSFTYERSGVAEIDDAGSALEATATRLAAVMERERAFSAEASHQLRTPTAALRTLLEAELLHPRGDRRLVLEEALQQVDRLDGTTSDLLALARDQPSGGPFSVDPFLDEVTDRWRRSVDDAQRRLVVRRPDEPLEVDASPAAIRQVVDVLVDNALTHGRGVITIEARSLADAAALHLAVSDEGKGIVGSPEAVFGRRRADGGAHGIGLSLARSLTEAEGGRLWLARTSPPQFVVVVPAHPGTAAPGAVVEVP